MGREGWVAGPKVALGQLELTVKQIWGNGGGEGRSKEKWKPLGVCGAGGGGMEVSWAGGSRGDSSEGSQERKMVRAGTVACLLALSTSSVNILIPSSLEFGLPGRPFGLLHSGLNFAARKTEAAFAALGSPSR